MKSSIFNELNQEQRKAVQNLEGSSVILAGAGSGKTRVLVCKVLNLIENGVKSSNILMITFTNKAASEMKSRIGEYKLGFVGTFHSLCARILRIDGEELGLKKNFVIYDEGDQLSLIKKIVKEKNIGRFTPSYILHRISSCKNELIPPQKYLSIFSDYGARDIATVYQAYQEALSKNSAVDFDDLIIKVVELFNFAPEILEKYQRIYKHVLVDEFQDTNPAQYILTRLIAQSHQNITVVGDFSQSIYSWRGADIRNLEKFQSDFPGSKIYYLEMNYRSTQNILDFAYKIISKNNTHPILNLQTEKNSGEEIVFLELDNEQEEAIFVATEIERLRNSQEYTSFALLYRTNAQSRILEEALLHYGISYTLVGGTRFYERREIKDILAYLRLLINPEDSVASERALKIGKRRLEKFKTFYSNIKDRVDNLQTAEIMEEIFKETDYLSLYNPDDSDDFSRLENIKELKSVALSFPNIVEFLEQIALVESEYFEKEKHSGENTIKLMTLHQAKGLEFDCVFITGVEEGLLPHSLSIDDHYRLEEERRLFYVGITRARHKLYVISTKRRFIFGRRNDTIKSRFLMEQDIDFDYNVS